MSEKPEPEPIKCRTVAGFLQAFAELLTAEAARLSVLDTMATSDEFSTMAGRISDRADYVRSIAARLYDQKGIIRDGEYLTLLLAEALPFLSEDHPPRVAKNAVWRNRADIYNAIEQYFRGQIC